MRVKRYERNVQQADIPSARFTVQSSPETFGAGSAQDLQNMGTALQKNSNTVQQFAVEHQERMDKATARDAITKSLQELIKLEQDIYSKRGLDASGAAEKLNAEMSKLRAAYLKQLKNARQKEYFAASFDSEMRRAFRTAYKHEIDQGLQAEADTIGAQNKLLEDQALQHRLNPEKIAENKTLIEANIRYLLKKNGASDEVVNQKIAESRHSLHETVFEALANDNPDLAEEYLKNNYAEFNPMKRDKKKAELETRRLQLAKLNEDIVKEQKRQGTMALAEYLVSGAATPQKLDELIALNAIDDETAMAAKTALRAKGFGWGKNDAAELVAKGKKSIRDKRPELQVYVDAINSVIAGDRDQMAEVVRSAIKEVSDSSKKTDTQDLAYILKVMKDRMKDWKSPVWDEFADATDVLRLHGPKAVRDFFYKWDRQPGTALPLAKEMVNGIVRRKDPYGNLMFYDDMKGGGMPTHVAGRGGSIQEGAKTSGAYKPKDGETEFITPDGRRLIVPSNAADAVKKKYAVKERGARNDAPNEQEPQRASARGKTKGGMLVG